MADDELKDAGGPETGRPKREPPTIDLDASEVSGETRAAAEAKAEAASEARAEAASEPEQAAATSSKPISPWVIAPFSGAVAAALVIAVGWMLGWPPVQAPPAAPQVTAGAFDDLGKRVAGLEAKTSKPAAPVSDPAAAARIDALDKSLAALRSDIAKPARAVRQACVRRQRPEIGAARFRGQCRSVRDHRPHRRARAQGASAGRGAREREGGGGRNKPADDMALRRVVAAALLDVAVRHGDPYAETLKVAKALSADPDKLKALDPFAEKGVPSPPQLNRELLTLVPKLSPAAGCGHDRHQHRRSPAGRCGKARPRRAHRYDRQRPRRDRGARHRGGAAQRFRRGAPRSRRAHARRSRARASLARQGRRARCRIVGLASIRR